MSSWKFPVILLFVLLAAGCASKPEPLAPSLTAQVREGMSRAEVHRILGRAKRASTGPDGRTAEAYFRMWNPDRSDVGRTAPIATYQARTLAVLYSAAGMVERVRLYETSGSVRRRREHGQLPQIAAGYQVTAADLTEIKAGETTRTMLVRKFDEPLAETLSPAGEVVCWWVRFTVEPGMFSLRADEHELRVVLNPDQTVKSFGLEERFGRDGN